MNMTDALCNVPVIHLLLFENAFLFIKDCFYCRAGRAITIFCPCSLDFLGMGSHNRGVVSPKDLCSGIRLSESN